MGEEQRGAEKNLVHFVRAAHERGMGVMPTMMYKFGEWRDKAAWPNSREFVADLVATIGKEPGLEIWDVENEPECCSLPPTADNRCVWNTPFIWRRYSTNSIL